MLLSWADSRMASLSSNFGPSSSQEDMAGTLKNIYHILTCRQLRGHAHVDKCNWPQWELFLSEVNNGETIAAIEANNDTYCLQKRVEKFPLLRQTMHFVNSFDVLIVLSQWVSRVKVVICFNRKIASLIIKDLWEAVVFLVPWLSYEYYQNTNPFVWLIVSLPICYVKL